jgi:NADPH-dependent curcumin reductase CurA
MSDAPSYAKPVGIGEVMEGGTVSDVVTSNVPGFAKGDIVVDRTGWQTHALSDGSGLQKVDPTRPPISTALGVLGMPGMTAYMGLLEIGRPAAGETVVVAAASGAVGSVVDQIARIKDARAVGIAGGPDKCRYVTEELGFDACIDHRAPDLAARLAAACPKGIDVYFENVGGAVCEAVFPLLNPFARIPVCGLISMYNATTLPPGPILLPHMMRAILTKRLTFRGFIVSDFAAPLWGFRARCLRLGRRGTDQVSRRRGRGAGERAACPYRPLARGEFWQTFGASCACLFMTRTHIAASKRLVASQQLAFFHLNRNVANAGMSFYINWHVGALHQKLHAADAATHHNLEQSAAKQEQRSVNVATFEKPVRSKASLQSSDTLPRHAPVPETRPTNIEGRMLREVTNGTAVLEGPNGT